MPPMRGDGSEGLAGAHLHHSSEQDFAYSSSSHHTPSDSYGSSLSSSSAAGSPRSSSGSSLPPATVIDIFGHPLPSDDALRRLPHSFRFEDDHDGGPSHGAGSSVPRTSLVVEDYDGGFTTEEDEAAEATRMLRHGSLSDETSYSSRLSSRAPSPVPSSPGMAFWGSTLSRKPSKAGMGGGEVEEKEYAVPDSDYFNSHHYRTSVLARKLGLPDRSSLSAPPKKEGKGWYSRRSKRKASVVLGSPSASSANLASKFQPRPGRLRRFWNALPDCGVSAAFSRFLAHPLVPTRPLTILFALVTIATVVTSITAFLIHALSTDKEPLPWRQYCQDQRAFPHAFADTLEPISVFVGVFSVDLAYERRHLIRSTYARHSRPIDPITGKPANNVQVKFILGKPRAAHARRVALEMETFNDIVVLDIKENMNRGKTHAFFTWANENATVPVFYRSIPEPKVKLGLNGIGGLHEDQSEEGPVKVGVGFQKADFVVKADDDSFIVLSELERHLRVAPRNKTYWGYLIRSLFMGGECYALSSDLVNYVATSPAVLGHLTGAEDKQVAKWMRIHPEASSINWVTERCWIYDHPKAGTTYSHGFLFPNEVERVRAEGRAGLHPEIIEARGGEVASKSYSTVSTWQQTYVQPVGGMSMEEEVEALVEGGGRFGEEWKAHVDAEAAVPWSRVVFQAGDERLRKAVYAAEGKKNRIARPIAGSSGIDLAGTSPPAEHYQEPTWRFGRPPSDLRADLGEVGELPTGPLKDALLEQQRQQAAHQKRASVEAPSKSESALLSSKSDAGTSATLSPLTPGAVGELDSTPHALSTGTSVIDPTTPPSHRHAVAMLPHDTGDPSTEAPGNNKLEVLISAPSFRYDPQALALRQRRFLGLPYGGTVVVHYLKRNEWFLETSLILLGRARTWDDGIVPAAYEVQALPSARTLGISSGLEVLDRGAELTSEDQTGVLGRVKEVQGNWFGGARMYGSPIVHPDGTIREGRPVEQPVLEEEEEEAARSAPAPVTEWQDTSRGWAREKPKHRLSDPEELDLPGLSPPAASTSVAETPAAAVEIPAAEVALPAADAESVAEPEPELKPKPESKSEPKSKPKQKPAAPSSATSEATPAAPEGDVRTGSLPPAADAEEPVQMPLVPSPPEER